MRYILLDSFFIYLKGLYIAFVSNRICNFFSFPCTFLPFLENRRDDPTFSLQKSIVYMVVHTPVNFQKLFNYWNKAMTTSFNRKKFIWNETFLKHKILIYFHLKKNEKISKVTKPMFLYMYTYILHDLSNYQWH